MRVVAVCGASKFKQSIETVSVELNKKGALVLPAIEIEDINMSDLSDDDKRNLDELIRNRIRLATEVFVLNPDGYIDERTNKEIEYAVLLDKSIRYTNAFFLQWENGEEWGEIIHPEFGKMMTYQLKGGHARTTYSAPEVLEDGSIYAEIFDLDEMELVGSTQVGVYKGQPVYIGQ